MSTSDLFSNPVLRRPIEFALAAAVRVMNAAPSRPSRMNRRLQGSQRERRVDGHGARVAHDFAAASIKNDSNVAEPDGNSDVDDVRPPQTKFGLAGMTLR